MFQIPETHQSQEQSQKELEGVSMTPLSFFCVCAWKFLKKITVALNHQVLGHLQILSNRLEFHDFDSEKNLHILENHTQREPYDLL